MVSTLWNIPGICSKQSQKFLERSLSPICVYDQQGQPIYASQSFLDLLQTEAGEVSFFDYFLSQTTPPAALTAFWQRSLQGEAITFFVKTHDDEQDIECSLQFDSDAKLMFLTGEKANTNGSIFNLMEEYERAIALFDGSNIATALVSSSGVIIKCNQKFQGLFGKAAQNIHIDNFVHLEDKLIDVNLKQELLNGDIESFTIEKRFISKENEVIWVNVNVSLINLSTSVNHHKQYFAVLLEDVTESRKVYNALIRTEEKWKTFVLNSPHLFIQTSNAGRIIYASPAVERLLGYKKEELLGQRLTDLIHPCNFNEFTLVFQVWMSNIQSSQAGVECWWKVKSGGWVSLYIQGQRYPSMLESDGVVISGYNTTDLKRLEVELKASEERFNTLTLNLPGAVFRCTPVYKMKYISHGIEDITGYPAAAFVENEAMSYLSIIHSDDIPRIKDSLIQSALDHHRSEIEYRIIHAKGRVIWVSERKQGVFDQSGNLLSLDGVLTDISDRKLVEGDRSLQYQSRG